MEFNVEIFYDCLISGLKYLYITVELSAFAVLSGCIWGLAVAVVRNYKMPIVSKIFAILVTVYQGIPLVVALLIYTILFNSGFNSFMKFLHINITVADVNFIVVGYFALTLSAVCEMSESFRTALKSIPVNQYEASYSVGLTRIQTLKRIIIPQMIPVAVPNVMNNVVGIIKSTSLVTAIGIVEMMSGALIPSGLTYSYIEGYTAAGLIYWGFTIIVLFLAHWIENKTKRYRRQP